jgi:hypothetical protein
LEKTVRRCDLIVVDELGYVPLDRIGAEHLFGFFSQCYEQTSLVVTTNLPFAEQTFRNLESLPETFTTFIMDYQRNRRVARGLDTGKRPLSVRQIQG